MTATQATLIFLAGAAAGFVNTVGGGGSLISLPVLIFLGLPSAVANGTNRIALMVQSVVAIEYFRKKGYFYPRLSIILGIPAVIGSILGAKVAISLSDEMFNKVLAAVMLTVMVLIIWRPEKKFLKSQGEENIKSWRLAAATLVFFGVGFYGGFIQAGVGFLIIAALTLITGMSLVKVNSLKVFVTVIYMLASFLVFVFSGKVDWVPGLVLAAGNAAGAYLGSAFTVAKGDKWIRVFLVVTVSIMSAKLLGLHKLP
ncbi:MAG: sulfite exporter TauE/SafE family protein [Peptococcaceae bacterium]|nr:sulfite exporter TauE/SafE family protein [Peptococcaceae bacterium]